MVREDKIMQSGKTIGRRPAVRPQLEESTMNWKLMAVMGALLGLALGALVVKRAVDAQRPRGNDTEQIQSLLLKGETAAEQRNSQALGKLISDDYRDGLGMTETQMRYQISDYLRSHRAIDVDMPGNAIQVEVRPDGRSAQAKFHARVSTQGGTPDGSTNSGGTIDIDMTLQLVKEPVHYFWVFPGEEWKIVSADGYSGLEGL
ncbi:MAG: hypothetical protein K0Q72_2883 [Armatimonadetes bacterium]|nr:hypothetical protein [Armatimonadota bacterium]